MNSVAEHHRRALDTWAALSVDLIASTPRLRSPQKVAQAHSSIRRQMVAARTFSGETSSEHGSVRDIVGRLHETIRATTSKMPLNERTHLYPSDLPAIRDAAKAHYDTTRVAVENLREDLASILYATGVRSLDEIVAEGMLDDMLLLAEQAETMFDGPDDARAMLGRSDDAYSGPYNGEEYLWDELQVLLADAKQTEEKRRAEFEAAHTPLPLDLGA